MLELNIEKLTPTHLKELGEFDKASRWYPNKEIAKYFMDIRSPSRAWPFSYYKAALTKKFVKWLKNNRPELFNV